jgi:hypothetical protein
VKMKRILATLKPTAVRWEDGKWAAKVIRENDGFEVHIEEPPHDTEANALHRALQYTLAICHAPSGDREMNKIRYVKVVA